MGTRRQNDVDATSLRRIDVVTTSCACWEFGPPWPPQYSKPSYAYDMGVGEMGLGEEGQITGEMGVGEYRDIVHS